MAYLYSLALRVTNNVMAPLKVAMDKSIDAITYSENKTNKTSDGIDKQSKNCETETDSPNKVPNKVQNKSQEKPDADPIVNLDGINQPETKKMMRLYPPTNMLFGYAYFFSSPTKVHDGLYLGSAYNASCWYTLEKLNIKYVVNVTAEISNYYESSGIIYYRIPIRDDNNESIQSYFDESCNKIEEFLSKKDGNVLVHCYMGASRSATIVARYIAKKKEIDIVDVLANLTKIRPIVNPTHQFMLDLVVETKI